MPSPRRRDALPVVAFNDPNDVLTFPLTAGCRDRLILSHPRLAPVKRRIIDVRVVNERKRWLFVFVSPERAHTGYWNNSDVMELIAKGSTHTP